MRVSIAAGDIPVAIAWIRVITIAFPAAEAS